MKKTVVLILLMTMQCFAQGNPSKIFDALYALRGGEFSKAESVSRMLASTESSESHYKYLDALLTEQGLQASFKYNALANVHKNTVFAEAALYRLYAYYYAIGSYSTAEKYKNELRSHYPNSVYNSYASLDSREIDQLYFDGMKTDVTTKKVVEHRPVTDGNYTLKIGAFIDTENVQKLKTSLEAMGYSVSISKKIVGGTEFTIVHAGSFLTENEAQQALFRVNNELGTNGKVIPK